MGWLWDSVIQLKCYGDGKLTLQVLQDIKYTLVITVFNVFVRSLWLVEHSSTHWHISPTGIMWNSLHQYFHWSPKGRSNRTWRLRFTQCQLTQQVLGGVWVINCQSTKWRGDEDSSSCRKMNLQLPSTHIQANGHTVHSLSSAMASHYKSIARLANHCQPWLRQAD